MISMMTMEIGDARRKNPLCRGSMPAHQVSADDGRESSPEQGQAGARISVHPVADQSPTIPYRSLLMEHWCRFVDTGTLFPAIIESCFNETSWYSASPTTQIT